MMYFSERKEAVDALEKVITENPRVERSDGNHERIPQLIKVSVDSIVSIFNLTRLEEHSGSNSTYMS